MRSTQIVAENTQVIESRAALTLAEKTKEADLRSAQIVAENNTAAEIRALQTVADVRTKAETELRSARLAQAKVDEQHQVLLAATASSSEIQAAEQTYQLYSTQVQGAQNKASNLKTQVGYFENAATHAVHERDQATQSLQAERTRSVHIAHEAKQELTRMDSAHQTQVATLELNMHAQHSQLEHAFEGFQSISARQRPTDGDPKIRTGHGMDTCFACTQPRRHECTHFDNGCRTSHFYVLSSLCLVCQQRKQIDRARCRCR